MRNAQPLILLLLIICVGCSGQNSSSPSTSPGQVSYSTPEPSKTDLTRQTVMSLVQGRIRENVIADLDQGSFYSTENRTDVFTQMVKDKIITCTLEERRSGEKTWINCVPGENGSGLYVSRRNVMSMVIGVKVPTEVTGISKIDSSRAEADVVLKFEPDAHAYAIFNKYSSAFWSNNLNQGSRHRVILKLYDDGWRLETWS